MGKMKVAVAMSGGVDSALAAALLKSEGYEVVGIFMENWTEDWGGCDVDQERKDALKVAMQLGIPFRVFNFEKEYQEEVIGYFYREYQAGRTPNPDVECNRTIKFGLFLETALKEEKVDKMATGHYARIQESTFGAARRGWKLFKGVDKNKDQSYFLWTLGQRELGQTLFPIGELTKEQVRAKARELDLAVADKPDSQGICFIGEVDIKKFLKRRLPEKEGRVVDPEGTVLGKHPGAYFFTIGQRHGLGIGGGIPYYVTAVDTKENVVTVAPINHPALFVKEAVVSDLNWTSGQEPEFPLRCQAKIRYRQPGQEAVVDKDTPGVRVSFKEEQRAVTPGQSAVFYQGDEVLGGGVISSGSCQTGGKSL